MSQFRLRTRLLREGSISARYHLYRWKKSYNGPRGVRREKTPDCTQKREKGTNVLPVITSNILIASTDIRGPQPQSPGSSSVAIKADTAFFSGAADFRKATFSGAAEFGKATFNGGAEFAFARFDTLAYFQDARFFAKLDLRHIQFMTSADFRNTYIRQLDIHNADSPAMIQGRLDFRRAKVSETHLQDVTFEKDVNFSDAVFGAPVSPEAQAVQPEGTPGSTCATARAECVTVFRFLTFEGHADFLRTHFTGPTSLERVTFRKDANFTGAQVKGHAEDGKPAFALSYVNVVNLRTKWSQLADPRLWAYNGGEPIRSFVDREDAERNTERRHPGQDPPTEDRQAFEPLSEVFKSLEATFRSQNQLEDANAAYYAMKIAELQEARRTPQVWQRVGVEAEWMFWGLLCGYGTKLWWVVGWALGINLLCTLIYSTLGTLHRRYNPKTSEDFTFKPRPWDFPKDYLTVNDPSATPSQPSAGEARAAPTDGMSEKASPSTPEHQLLRTLIDALRFSSTLLFKLGYRDTTVSGQIGPWDLRWLVRLEWALGFVLMAALTYTLGSTQPLLNKLVHGVF